MDIKFNDEVKALILLSSLFESWSATVTVVSRSTGKKNLKLQAIRDLILREDICRIKLGEFLGAALNTEGRARSNQRGWN